MHRRYVFRDGANWRKYVFIIVDAAHTMPYALCSIQFSDDYEDSLEVLTGIALDLARQIT